MKRIVVSVYDRKLVAFGQPWFVPAVGAAIRAFGDEINGDGPAAKHPGDYELFELGVFDEETGKFTNLDAPRQLAIGDQMLIPKG